MKKLIPIALVLIVLILIIYRIATQGSVERAQSISEIQKTKGVPVEVSTVGRTELSRYIHLNGTVEGIEQGKAIASVSDKIVELNARIGDYVQKGDIIAKLDPENPQARVTQAELALQDAERELKRMEALQQIGAVSQQMLDKTKLAYDIAESNLQQARTLIWVKSPISGVIVDLPYAAGETPPPGEAVATVAKVERIRVKVEASPEQRGELRVGQEAWIYLTAAPQKRIKGRVEKVALSADPKSRMFKVYITAENRDGYLQPGIPVETEVTVEKLKDIIAIPRDALTKVKGKTVVYLASDRAKMVEVVTGITVRELVEIKSGLSEGQEVVVHGLENLSDGDPLLVVGRE